MKKTRMTRKTKDEKRRLAFEKRNVKKEINLARYGAEGGSALVMAKTTDFNRRFVAAFMALVFAISCIVIGINFAARADDPVPAQTSDDNSNLVLEKTLSAEPNGTYTLQLSAYAKGKIKDVNEQIPTDYVLIADQSGSMSTNDVPTGYNNGTTKNWKVSDGANAYYYKETDANGVDHYYRVYRKYGDMYEYHAPDTVYTGNCIGNLSWFQREQVQDLGAASEYYYNPALDTSDMKTGVSTDNRMYPVLVSSQGAALSYWIRFRFTDINGTTYTLKYPDTPYYKSPTGGLFGPGDWWGPVPYTSRLLPPLIGANDACKALSGNNDERYTYGEFLGITTGMYVRQVLFSRHNNYSQLAYRDDNGVEHLLIDATYCNSSGTPVGGACDANGVPSGNHTSTTEAYWNGTLYSASGTTTRLNALKAAMNEFINTVADQQNEGGSKPNHRVAIVGFAGGQSDSNTELLTGTNFNISTSGGEKSGIQYRSLNNNYYKNALLDVTDATQLTRLRSAVDALEADGGTQGEYGFYMAKNILDQRELTKFTTKGNKEVDRLTIVVYFTDGTPGNYENDNQYAYGNEVIDAAHQIKTDSKIPNAEIYSIGTFGFADSEPLVYEKYTGNNDEYKFDPDYVKTLSGTWNSGYMYRLWLRNTQGYGDVATDTVYDYMRTITTEFKDATKFVDASWYGTGTKSDNGVYTDMVSRVRGDSNGLRRYFLCTDLSSLSRVFITIGSEETEAGTEIELDETNSYLQDVLSDNFEKTDDTVVTAKTYYGWMDSDTAIEPRWGSDYVEDLRDQIEWVDEKTLQVRGFNYTENYIAYGKSSESGYPVANRGKKLVVTIPGLVPNKTGENLASNSSTSGIMHDETVDETTTTRTVAEFETPTISRHKYVLNVGNDKPSATFDTIYTLVPNEGKTAADKSIILRNGSTANRYDEDNSIGITGAANENTTYVEYITSGGKDGNANPNDYTLNAGVSTSDTAFTYYLSKTKYLYGTEQTDENKLQNVSPLSLGANIDGNLFVTSKANNHNITIKNETVKSSEQDEDYSDPTKKFPIKLTLTKTDPNAPDITGPISGVTFTNGEGVVNLAKDEEVTLTLPVGYSIKVEDESDPSAYSTTYKLDNGDATSAPTTTTTSSDHTIIVRHERDKDTIATTGVTDEDGSNGFIYLLAGVGALTTGAGAAYVYRKKDEFVEQ